MRERIAFDAHIHTEASGDAANTLGEVLELLHRRGDEGRHLMIAITDHNVIDPELLEILEKGVPIIVGEEIKTGAENTSRKKLRLWVYFLKSRLTPKNQCGRHFIK